jgi:GNAT superfamily N-acetyltransferase
VSGGSEAALVAAMGADGGLAAVRLSRGCRAFAVCVEDQVAAYGWVSTGTEWIGEIRLEISPGEGEAYLWNCVTLPAHRRRGIFQGLIGQVAGRLQSEGRRRVWIAEAGGPAVPALPAAGYRPVIKIGEERWWILRRLRVAPATEADPDAVAAARRALSLGAARIGLVPGPRRH